MKKFAAGCIAALALTCLAAAQSIDEVAQLRRDGNLDQALRVAESLVAADGASADAYYALGEVMVDREDWQGAEQAFAKTEELDAQDLAAIGRGRILLAQGKMEEAKRGFDSVGESARDRWDLYYHRALAHAGLRDYSASATDMEKSLELKPDNAKAHYYAGLAYNALRRPDKMVEHFQTYLKMEPDGPEAARVRSVLRGVR